MIAGLWFRVGLPFLLTEYKVLRGLGRQLNKMGNGLWCWEFPLSSAKEVMALLGRSLELKPEDVELVGGLCCGNKKTITVPKWKGSDVVEILRTTDRFRIVTHQKFEADNDKGYTVRTLVSEVPVALVGVVWNVIRKQPLGKRVKTRTVTENVLDFMGVDRFHRQSGSFDFQKLFGSRKDYRTFFYYPVKVLVAEGVVRHHKMGFVERLKESWSCQAVFVGGGSGA